MSDPSLLVLASLADGVIVGLGSEGYLLAATALLRRVAVSHASTACASSTDQVMNHKSWSGSDRVNPIKEDM